MEKVIVTLRAGSADEEWAERIRGPVADELLGLQVPGLTVNVRDDAVRDALMTLTTLDPPVQGFVTLWTQQYYGEQVSAALDLLASARRTDRGLPCHRVRTHAPATDTARRARARAGQHGAAAQAGRHGRADLADALAS